MTHSDLVIAATANVRAPKHPVSSSSSIDAAGHPICVYCRKRLRWFLNGYGYAGSGHFCNKTCAAEWADLKVTGTSDDSPRERLY